jgi:hypothetical protein
VSKKQFILISLIIVVIGGAIVFSEYSLINTLLSFFYLLIVSKSYANDTEAIFNKQFDWFYWIAYVAITIQLLMQVSAGGLSLDMFTLQSGCWDANYTYVALFSFYIYADAKKHKSWIPLAIATTYFNRSRRGIILMVTLFFSIKIIKFIRHKLHKDSKPWVDTNSFYKCFKIISGATIVAIAFSFIWITYISATGTVSYHEGINDGSNAVRFGSNIYAIETVFSDPRFLIAGYDNDIQSVLGDSTQGTYTVYRGYRLVQSHNSVINMFLKNGILFTFLYYLIFCRVFNKYFQRKYIEYWLPYLINAMLMHGMFITDYLLLFILGMSTVYWVDHYSNDNDLET